ncbi:H+/gluconate symporter-like permease [Cytobacillus oceanisediminis]|jgi:H+/gluconate symporter-like permease|uniref:H+/gluconate symporter-like permease n=1 Tax=Cytobacillus oceanisediminis TaxID=665099 RepID=A0A2V3A3R5_9BACI|nr:GntP family permease [Cytobacillus oceanisediminis]PWW31466.1 H+/gluconate symporter-like permease [Cytobacillus oceanisediminis]
MIGMLGLIASLLLLMYLTMKGINIIIAAIISAVVVALTGGLNLETALTEHYMTGFTKYFYSWFLIFLLGAIFGKIMQVTKAADSIANWVKDTLGPSRAVFAVVAAAAIMTYGGVSLFVVGFAVYPIAVSLFKVANLPHRFIPAALVFGSISFTMTAPGSPEIQNLIPTEFFGTKPTAGGIIGVLMALLIMVVGGLLLSRMVKKAVQNGEVFSLPNQPPSAANESAAALDAELAMQRPDAVSAGKDYPHVIMAILPLAAVIAILNTAANFTSSTAAALISLSSGIILACLLMIKYLVGFWEALAKGAQDALVAAANTCAVVGFGSVAAQVAAFGTFVDALVNIPGPPLMGLAIAVTLICGITGSASGGLGIALPILAPMYMSQGLDPGSMHRISALASGGLDSLPHNGYVVTTIRAICGETHKRSYWPIFILSVAMPTAVLILAVILYSIF